MNYTKHTITISGDEESRYAARQQLQATIGMDTFIGCDSQNGRDVLEWTAPMCDVNDLVGIAYTCRVNVIGELYDLTSIAGPMSAMQMKRYRFGISADGVPTDVIEDEITLTQGDA